MSDHAHDHPDYLAHHFDTPDQQFEAGKLGMWLFLVTEVLMFGGLFCIYALTRYNHPEIYEYAHGFLDWKLGATNTAVLLASSFTMAMAVRAAQLGQQKALILLLSLTLCGGFGFLIIKYIEYTSKFSHQLYPGTHNLYYPLEFSGIMMEGPDGEPVKMTLDQQREKIAEVELHTLYAQHGYEPTTWAAYAAYPKLVEEVQSHAAHGGAEAHTEETPPGGQSGEHAGDAGHGSAHAEAISDPAYDYAAANALVPIASATADGSLSGNLAIGTPGLTDGFAHDVENGGHANDSVLANNPLVQKFGAYDASHNKVFTPYAMQPQGVQRRTHMFFQVYYMATGLHALHVIIGMGCITWVLGKSLAGAFTPEYNVPVDIVGLYWHIVDLIWIFLFPLLYLIH